ncbi:MAG TPA: MFS transporter [Chloroflexota bacterium]|jgi:EmrB/QacA subfamily drug resistance transporter|nr:MFS transporter [Chloroflexota bacterium]
MAVNLKAPCDEAAIEATPPCVTPAPPTVSSRWVLAATILGSSMAFIDGTVVNVALPVLQEQLKATAAQVQWIVEAYALFLAALILVGGSLGDRFGRKRIFGLGTILFTLASVACGLAPTSIVLIVARAVQGIGGALLVPSSLAIIGATFTGAARGKAIGTWSGFTTLTSALGPVLGGWLVQSVSWRAVFFINVPLAVLVLLVFRHVPESRDETESGRLDWLGAALVTLGLGLVVFGLIEWGALGLGTPVVLGALAAGIVALALFVAVEAHNPHPMLPLTLFRSRTFSGGNLLTLLLYGALGAALYYLPFNLQQVHGYSATATGATLLPLTAIMFGLSRWTGGLVGRFGARLPLTIGPAIVGFGFLLFALPGTTGSYWSTYFPAIVVLGLGMTITVAPLTTAVLGAVDSRQSGIASGVNNAVSRAAGLLAIAVLGIVVSAIFSSSLDSRMAALRVPAAVRHALDAQHNNLAAAQVPAGVSPSLRSALQQAIKDAFLSGFRVDMLICAGLAFLSALCAALLIDGKQREPAAQAARAPVRASIAPSSIGTAAPTSPRS